MSAQPLADVPVNSTTPAMSFTSDSTSSAEASPAVQTLHQGNLASLEVQRQLLAQKLAEKNSATFTSPTDQLMTPCSKKLADHKKKAYGKSQPKLLSKAFSGLVSQGGKENKPSSLSQSKNPFGAEP